MDTMAPTRPGAPRKLRMTLTAGPVAAAAARYEVRAAIHAWNVPVDSSVAALLTSELIASALARGSVKAIELVVSCACRQLQVDVYGTPTAMAAQVGAPPGARARPEPGLPASLPAGWGHSRAPTGYAGYFTLAF